MRVLLVNPNSEDHASYVVLPHIGLGYLAAALKARGHEVSMWDGLRMDASAAQLVDYVAAHGPFDVIGVSIFTTFFGTATKYLRLLKARWPDAVYAAGGPHATFLPEETLKRVPELDFIVRAEGEEAFPALLAELAKPEPDLGSVPNLVWREPGGKLRSNAVKYLESLDVFSQPDWELLAPDKFPLKPNGIFTKSRRIVPMVVTRGCPYECTFCGAPTMTGRPLRRRRVDLVLDEIQQLQARYGVDEFHFMDDNFTLNQPYLRDFCQGVLDRGLKIHWACPNGVRLDSLRPRTLKLMEASGCYSFAVGIEVGTQRMLDAIKKDLTLPVIRDQLDMIAETAPGIRVTGFFILGLPQETLADVWQTIKFSLSLPLARANFFNYSPFPGNELFMGLRGEGKLEDLDYSKVYIHSIAYEHPTIPGWQLRALMQLAHAAFYLRPRILLGILREIHSWSQAQVVLQRVYAITLGGRT